jgi:DNA-binding NarL/FixJ family response regulator
MEITGNKLRILIADDSEVIRRALNNLLAQNSDQWGVCGEVNNGEDTVTEAQSLRPDVVLLDLSIPLLNGVTVAKTIKRDYPDVKVVLISEQDAFVLSRIADAAGTPYYVPKSRLALDLIPLLLSLVKGTGK